MEDFPRWVYRFENFKKAFLKLEEAVNLSGQKELSDLEKEGVIQRFEFTFEIFWKLLKDYLQHEGISLETSTPRNVIREAFKAGLISDGDGWRCF
jgi:nucleotidyltransferase substrate binding protein (TIGR01987 family)